MAKPFDTKIQRFGAMGGALLLGIFLSLNPPLWLQRFQDLGFDSYQRASPRVYDTQTPVRVVDIDDASLKDFGQWPWPRDRLATLTRILQEHGARGIAFDIVFAEEDRASLDVISRSLSPTASAALKQSLGDNLASNDRLLAEALTTSATVLAQILTTNAADKPQVAKAGFAFLGDNPASFALPFSGSVYPIPVLGEAAKGIGAINTAQESDTIIRRIPLVFALQNGLVPSLDLELLRVAQDAPSILIKSSNASNTTAFGGQTGIISLKTGDLIINTDATGAVRPHFTGEQAMRHISAAAILHDPSAAEMLRDRLVLIGTTAQSLNDIRATPLSGAVAGIDIHAEFLENVFAGTLLLRPDDAPAYEALASIILALLAGAIGLTFRPFAGAILAIFLIFAVWTGSFLLFKQAGLLIDALIPASTALIAYSGTSLQKYWQVERQRRWVSQAFSRYVAPDLVAKLSADPSQLKLGGETRNLTIMFCDVRDFTTRAQNMGAEDVVRFLNRVHTPFTEVILKSGGTVDKFLGDGLMAFWNAPLPVPNHAQRATEAAIAMLNICKTINLELTDEAKHQNRPHLPLNIGIGLNTGDVFVGNMGSDQRFDYSIIGDAVNIAARLEAETKLRNRAILLSETTAQACTGLNLVKVGDLELKGRSGQTAVYSLE